MMSNVVQCHVPNTFLQEACSKAAAVAKRKQYMGNPGDYVWLCLNPDGDLAGNTECRGDRGPVVSISEFMEALLSTLRIDGNEVVFRPDNYDGIQVGCTKIPTAIVDEIHKRLHAK